MRPLVVSCAAVAGSADAHPAGRILLAAIEKAGKPEPAAIRTALEEVGLPHGDIKLRFRAWDHQMLMRVLVPEVKTEIKDPTNYFDIETRVPEKPDGLEALYGDNSKIGCTMPS